MFVCPSDIFAFWNENKKPIHLYVPVRKRRMRSFSAYWYAIFYYSFWSFVIVTRLCWGLRIVFMFLFLESAIQFWSFSKWKRVCAFELPIYVWNGEFQLVIISYVFVSVDNTFLPIDTTWGTQTQSDVDHHILFAVVVFHSFHCHHKSNLCANKSKSEWNTSNCFVLRMLRRCRRCDETHLII